MCEFFLAMKELSIIHDGNRRSALDELNIGTSRTGDDEGTNVIVLPTSISKPEIESLRDTVGDFGIALFAPLLDFEKGDDRDTKFSSTKANDTITSSSTTITTQAESESDQYRSEDENDADDDDDADYDGDEREFMLETVQIVHESMTQINTCPPILSDQSIQHLQTFLPFSIRDYIWERRFVIGLHGDSFCTLLQKCEGYKNSIVVIRTTSGQILGGYASEEWRVCSTAGRSSFGNDGVTNYKNKYRSTGQSYYGTGQSFIFGSTTTKGGENDSETTICVYPWTGHNDYCQICDVDRSIICMGGVGEFGWIVSDNFTVGRTGPCATYNNPPLIEDTTFRIADFEIYSLISPIAHFFA